MLRRGPPGRTGQSLKQAGQVVDHHTEAFVGIDTSKSRNAMQRRSCLGHISKPAVTDPLPDTAGPAVCSPIPQGWQDLAPLKFLLYRLSLWDVHAARGWAHPRAGGSYFALGRW